MNFECGMKNESANSYANKQLQIWKFENVPNLERKMKVRIRTQIKNYKYGTSKKVSNLERTNESANLYANKQLKIWNFDNVSNLEQKRKCKFARKLTSCEVGC